MPSDYLCHKCHDVPSWALLVSIYFRRCLPYKFYNRELFSQACFYLEGEGIYRVWDVHGQADCDAAVECQYSNDFVCSPIVEELNDVQMVENSSQSLVHLNLRNEAGFKFCIPYELVMKKILCHHDQSRPGVRKLLGRAERSNPRSS